MATQGGGQPDHLIDRLVTDGARFDFFQAVRLVQLLSSTEASSDSPLGSDAAPWDEPLRFHTRTTSGFPATAVHQIERRAATRDDDPDRPTPATLDMTVQFFGLTGPNGALPRHFTSMLIEQRRANNFALERFQDLFNHRAVSLFYRAWEKHQYPIWIEREHVRHERPEPSAFTRCLMALVGVGLPSTRRRLSVDDRAFVFFGGHYARRVPSAAAIADTVAEYFDAPGRVEQFTGQWLDLETEDRSRFGDADRPDGQNMALGLDTVLGDRIWHVESRFRIRLGPLNYAKYRSFLPDQPGLRALCELVRVLVGPQFDFDIAPVLLADEVPDCILGADDPRPRLGWTTFLKTSAPERDFADAVFERPDL